MTFHTCLDVCPNRVLHPHCQGSKQRGTTRVVNRICKHILYQSVVDGGRYFLHSSVPLQSGSSAGPANTFRGGGVASELQGSGRKCAPMHAPVACSPTEGCRLSHGCVRKRLAWRGLCARRLTRQYRNCLFPGYGCVQSSKGEADWRAEPAATGAE